MMEHFRRLPALRILAFGLFVFGLLALVHALGGCDPPLPPEPPVVVVATDAGDFPFPPDYAIDEHPEGSAAAAVSPCGRACASLRALGCPEGSPSAQGASCYRGCLSMARHQRVPTNCWTLSKTAEDVRRCGGIRCFAPDATSPN
jgi:hypothetical protein